MKSKNRTTEYMRSMGSIETATCDAMREQGIEAANTQKGIEFCTEFCPYDHCVIAEAQKHGGTSRGVINYHRVKELADTMTSMEIAEELHLSRSTVVKYMKKIRQTRSR